MSKEDIRREEDFFASIGLTICDGCAKKNSTSCRICAKFYKDQFVIDPVVKAVRGE